MIIDTSNQLFTICSTTKHPGYLSVTLKSRKHILKYKFHNPIFAFWFIAQQVCEILGHNNFIILGLFDNNACNRTLDCDFISESHYSRQIYIDESCRIPLNKNDFKIQFASEEEMLLVKTLLKLPNV